MSFAKESQALDGTDVLSDVFNVDDENDLQASKDMPSLEDIIMDFHPQDDEFEISVDQESDGDLVLTLDNVPGGLDQDEIVHDNNLEVEESEDVIVNDDPWGWTVDTFLPWLAHKMANVPPHSGRDTAGLERAIAYLETLDKEISKAVRMDIKNALDIEKIEKARDEIMRGVDRLSDRHEKVKASKYPKRTKNKKKKADDEQDGLVKEASYTGGIVVSVPLLISGLARVCINGMVSGGHDIEDMFKKLAKKFKLSDREQFELVQLLQDMNYPVRRDRGFLISEDIDTTSSENFDWNANYPG